tara:strand:- start:698 stop:1114 length:417 start_codon:yes stop_codon:yes gene_type:complete
MLQYSKHAAADSMFNTPPTFAWYLSGKVFAWLKGKGGLDSMGEINRQKAKKLYDFIDHSEFYINSINQENRSIMNVTFLLKNSELDVKFLHEAKNAGLLNLKGHRSVGGMRASIYNAIPIEAVDALINFMGDFQSRHG